MATISGVARPAYVYDAANNQWVPIGVGPHTHSLADLPSVVSTNGGSTIVNQAPTLKGLVIQGASAQTANLFEIQNSSGTATYTYSSAGNVGIGTTNLSGKVNISSANATTDLTIEPYGDSTKRHVIQADNDILRLIGTWTGGTPGGIIAMNTGGATGGEHLRIDASGNIQFGDKVEPNTLRYFDIYNRNTGSSAGAIMRFVTSNSDNSSITTVDMVKYRVGGAFVINNNQSGGYTSFGVGGTEHMRINSAGVNTDTGFVGPLVGGTSLTSIVANNTVFAANTNTVIGKFPYTTASGVYAIRVAWGYGDNNAGTQYYWETNFGGILGVASASAYFNGSPSQEVVMYGTHHHSNLASTSNPKFFLYSDSSNNPLTGYGALTLYIKFPQITKIDGFTIQIKRLI
jgi:hypothetical protein